LIFSVLTPAVRKVATVPPDLVWPDDGRGYSIFGEALPLPPWVLNDIGSEGGRMIGGDTIEPDLDLEVVVVATLLSFCIDDTHEGHKLDFGEGCNKSYWNSITSEHD